MPYVLKRGCMRYPDMKSLSARLDELYGAYIEPAVRQKGEALCVGFYSSFVDGKYLPGNEKTLDEAISLTALLLLEPATRDGLLNQDYVNSEKENLCDRIRSSINDKRLYAVRRLRENMCNDENYGVYPYGTIDSAKKINYVTLTKYYSEMVAESEIFMFYCGSADAEYVVRTVRNAFATLPRSEKILGAENDIRFSVDKVKYITEEMEIAQGNLAMGFRLGDIMYAPNYAAISVFNAVYGGGVNSKLFSNVREKLSLCYYASSFLDMHKGIMTVSSGIDPEKYSDALNEILSQLDKCRNGEISAEEISAAKLYLSDTLRSYADSPYVMDDFYLSQKLYGLHYGLEEYAGLVEMVDKADVVKAAQSTALDTVFFLKSKEVLSE